MNTDNTNQDKNSYIEEAKTRLAKMKGDWEAKKAQNQMDANQAEMENRMQDLQRKLDELGNAAEDKWEDAKAGFENGWNGLKAK